MHALKKNKIDYDLEKPFKCLKKNKKQKNVWTFFSITSL